MAFLLLAVRALPVPPLAGRAGLPDARACPPGASALGRGVPLATRVAMMPKVPTIGAAQPEARGVSP